jgi:hypothetical protein
MIPPELVAVARQIYAEDCSEQFGPRAVAWWGLVWDLVLNDDEEARTLGLRMLVRAWEAQEAEIERLRAKAVRPRRRFWQLRRGRAGCS